MRSAGLEGIRLQANPRPAGCGRAPSAPPKHKTPAQAGVFHLRAELLAATHIPGAFDGHAISRANVRAAQIRKEQ